MDWALMVDSLDLRGVSAVPITVLIDEAGVVFKARARMRDLEAFLSEPSIDFEMAAKPQIPDLVQLAAQSSSAHVTDLTDPETMEASRRYFDALFLWGGTGKLDEAILMGRSILEVTDDAKVSFHLGVALQSRYGENQDADEFADAIKAGYTALPMNTNQYT